MLKALSRFCGRAIRRMRGRPPPLREEFRRVRFAGHALQKLLDDYEFSTVVDIGSGGGEQVRVFLEHRKKVTAVDLGESRYFREKPADYEVVLGDFNRIPLDRQFDCAWASHVLEHQPDVQGFLERVHAALKEGGVLAVTVPPLKHEIVGGHLSLWNAGLLLYRLVLAGFDCRDAAVLSYGYNISVIVRKRRIELPELAFDTGDVDRLAAFLPPGLREGFNGDICRLNW